MYCEHEMNHTEIAVGWVVATWIINRMGFVSNRYKKKMDN